MEYKFESVNKLFERTIRDNWNIPALSNYNGETLSYGDVARRIEELHVIFSRCGLKPGDKVALCGKNHVNWAVGFLATMTYGAVPVPLLHEFQPVNIHFLVSHSESRFLFVDDQIWGSVDFAQMPGLVAAASINKFSIIASRCEQVLQKDIESQTSIPAGFGPGSLDFYEDRQDEVAIINYTSGTSGFSKGVVLTYLNVWSNLFFAVSVHSHMKPGTNIVSILPSAHMYGLMFELLFQFSRGVHIHFLTRIPSPKIVMEAMSEIRPDLIIAVPLVVEKIYKNVIEAELNKGNVLWLRKNVPFFEDLMLTKIRVKLIQALGGRFDEIIIGGAAFNKEVEQFFHRMKFPFTVGYGMTECAPIITYSRWDKAKVGSSGKAAPNMEVRIDSPDPLKVPGEILCKGANVFKGYFKNDEETAKAFTEDGWFRTGDMGVVDKDGYLFIKGRSKCMILGSNGQNIYPEELESVINNLPYVVESLVVDDGGNLTALIYPDWKKGLSRGMDAEKLRNFINERMADANRQFSNYCKIKKVEFLEEDFERTPKKSIKRFLYQK